MLAFASAGGPQTARAPAYELVGELLSEDGATRKNAADELRRLQDKTLLAALHDVVSFFQRVDERRAREVARLMQDIAGDKVRDTNSGWTEWIGRHEAIESKPGYLALEGGHLRLGTILRSRNS